MYLWRQVLPCLRSTGSALKVKPEAVSGCFFFGAGGVVCCRADELLTAVLALAMPRFQTDVDQGVLTVVRT